MRAHLFQYDIAWEDRERNFERVRTLAGSAGVEPGDLVLLPEMFDSGFSLRVEVTNDDDGRSQAFVAELASELRATVQAGLTRTAEGGMGRNRAIVFDPQASLISQYDKVHPFSYGREGERFEGGSEVGIYDWSREGAHLRVCPVICYDLRFPELFRRGLSKGAELFAIGANWPDARADHWRTLCVARAIENQAFVLGTNRCGRDPHLSYAGGTIAVSPRGEILGELGDREGVLSVEIDPESVRSWRQEFPAWRDAKSWLGGPTPMAPSGGRSE